MVLLGLASNVIHLVLLQFVAAEDGCVVAAVEANMVDAVFDHFHDTPFSSEDIVVGPPALDRYRVAYVDCLIHVPHVTDEAPNAQANQLDIDLTPGIFLRHRFAT